jgi:hypothetical protein
MIWLLERLRGSNQFISWGGEVGGAGVRAAIDSLTVLLGRVWPPLRFRLGRQEGWHNWRHR